MALRHASPLLERGNIDLHHRPVVHNRDGSVSTVRSITVGVGPRRYALLPTVVGKRVVSNDQAIRHFLRTGRHLGIFRSELDADLFARSLHEQQAQEYLPQFGSQELFGTGRSTSLPPEITVQQSYDLTHENTQDPPRRRRHRGTTPYHYRDHDRRQPV